MSTFRHVVIVLLCLSVVANLASSYYEAGAPFIQRLAAWGLICALVTLLIAEFGRAAFHFVYRRRGRYAAQALVLDADRRLLLMIHPYHRRRIPIAGRIALYELPHEAVERLLRSRAGFAITPPFSTSFHTTEEAYSNAVENVPQPYRVQRENRPQRGLVPFHYTFIYVMEASKDAPNQQLAPYYPRWYSLDEVLNIDESERPFDDVIRRYREVLDALSGNAAKEPVRQ
jgi:hypothetical protein